MKSEEKPKMPRAKKIPEAVEKTAEPIPAPVPALPWDTTLSLQHRLLLVRNELRTTQLWERFRTERDFDAFSIHLLAREVEAVLNHYGVTFKFSLSSWEKNGNATVVSGTGTFRSVDNGDTDSVDSAGEGIDDGDKGLSKALSTARKNCLISALNLGVGINIEGQPVATAEPKPAPPVAAAQAAPTPPPPPPVPAVDPSLFTLNLLGVEQKVRQLDVMVRCIQAVQTLGTVEEIDDFQERNQNELRRFWAVDKSSGFQISSVIADRKVFLNQGNTGPTASAAAMAS